MFVRCKKGIKRKGEGGRQVQEAAEGPRAQGSHKGESLGGPLERQTGNWQVTPGPLKLKRSKCG